MKNEQLTLPKGEFYAPLPPISYIEALPSNPDVLAVDAMDVSGSSLFADWLTALFEGRSITYQFRPPTDAVKKVRHLYGSGVNKAGLFKDSYLGFGYPMLIKKDNKAQYGIAAIPIFIWSVDLQPDKEDFSLWSITPKQSLKGMINPVLKSWSAEVKELVLTCEQTIEQTKITGYLCNEFCQQLATLLNYENERPVYGIDPYPDLEELMILPYQGQIIWSGVFSEFPPFRFYNFSEEVLTKAYWQAKMSEVPVGQLNYSVSDHYQKAAQTAIAKYPLVTVKAPTGTGQMHTIINVLVDNLINQRSTLLLANTHAELNKISARLTEKGLQDYTYHFKSLRQDKERLLELLTPKVAAITKLKNAPHTGSYKEDYSQFLQVSNQLNELALLQGKNVFDINNRTETIGLFLQNNKADNKGLLDIHLNAADFSFSTTEFIKLEARLVEGKRLFQEAFSFKHALADLNNDCFLEESKEEAKKMLASQIKTYLKTARSLQRKLLLEISTYKDELERHYYQYEKDTKQVLVTLSKQIAMFEQQFAGSYKKASLGNLKFRKVFSGKPGAALPEKVQILASFEQFKQSYYQQTYFDFAFPETESSNLDHIKDQLAAFQESFQTWQQQYRSDVADRGKHLSSKTAHTAIPFKERLEALELSIEQFIQEINDYPLFTESLSNNSLTLPLQLQFLEDIINRLNQTHYHLRDFEEYYGWRQYWQGMNVLEKKVVQSIIAVRPPDWQQAFKSWYFEHLLSKEPTIGIATDYDKLATNYLTKYDEIAAATPNFIRNNWAKQNWTILNYLREQSIEAIPNLLKPLSSISALTSYFINYFSTVTTFFPIQLITVDMFEQLLGDHKTVVWDQVILLGAANMSKEQGASILMVAAKAAVFDRGNKTGAHQESFWEAAKAIAEKSLVLRMQHRTSPLPLLHFTNVAYGHLLEIPQLNIESDVALQCYHTSGMYKEATRINEEEARYIIDLLAKIYSNIAGKLPLLGIACATQEQRDFIVYRFLQIKQAKATNSDVIHAFEKRGMGVFTFQELVGQSFDTLLVSLTYGPVGDKNILSKDLKIYNTIEGEWLLQNLLTCDAKNMIFCNSISIIYKQLYQQEVIGTGLYLYYNFLDYLVANQNTNKAKLQTILHRLTSGSIEIGGETASSAFVEQVTEYLGAYFDPARIVTNFKVGNQQFPILIKSSLQRKHSYILLVDSYAKNADAFSFIWQRQAQQALELEGYRFLQIWSKDWWKNPEEEARQLAKLIIRADNDFS